MNGAVSGTSVMVPQAHQEGAARTAGALSLYSLKFCPLASTWTHGPSLLQDLGRLPHL